MGPARLPLLAVRNLVLFPGQPDTLLVGRPPSRRLIEEGLGAERLVAIFTQRYDVEERDDDALPALCRIGVAARVEIPHAAEDGRLSVPVQGLARVAIRQLFQDGAPRLADVTVVECTAPPGAEDRSWNAVHEELRSTAERLLQLAPESEATRWRPLLENAAGHAGMLADLLAAFLPLAVSEKQDLLEELDTARRVRAVLQRASDHLEITRLRRKIRQDAAANFSATQRRAYLQEELRVIRRELGEGPFEKDPQFAALQQRFSAAAMPAPVREEIEREFARLAQLRPVNAEFPILVDFLETALSLPWTNQTEDRLDLAAAREALDRTHYDLENAKRRLLEHLAVRKLNPTGSHQMICLLGPPGVGKSSLGRAIADALGRKCVSIHLGAVRDESDILGVRRPRPGAAPGRILLELQRSGVRNPVILLEEIDQLGPGEHGDAPHALLEAIRSGSNRQFTDQYLNLPFDLSAVIFVATARFFDDVPPILREWFDVIRLTGYSDDDKREIARRHLVPRQLAAHGLTPEQCRFEDAAIARVIEDYTREAGLRGLERQLAALCRAAVARVVQETPAGAIVVSPAMTEAVLGPPRFLREARLATANPGVVTGLAWTSVGGEIMHIEVLRFPGKGAILLTGQLGTLMRESAQAALSLVKSRARQLGVKLDEVLDSDLHVHVPAGAVPKDGPSAGVAIFTAMASLWTRRAVRHDLAMTGEITLRGLVLPVGGLKEKILAAQHSGLLTVVLPKLNEKDLVELPARVRAQMKFVLVETVDDVLAAALTSEVAHAGKPRSAKRGAHDPHSPPPPRPGPVRASRAKRPKREPRRAR